MSGSMLVHVTGNVRSGKSQRSGKDYSVTDCWVLIEGEPYPVKLELFSVSLPAGKYQVPYRLELYNGRLQVAFDFTKATQAQAK